MMENKNKGKDLIAELVYDPILFSEQRKGYDLYKEYSNGFKVETLIPLLNSNNEGIVKVAIWITSEIAVHACGLLPYVLKHIDSSDYYIRYHSLVFIMLCSSENNRESFIHIVQSITDDNTDFAVLTMLLLSNANANQLSTAIEIMERHHHDNYELHKIGLTNLLNAKELDEIKISDMLRSHQRLIQQYGAILIKRKGESGLKLINEAMKSDNPTVREFALVSRDFM